MTSNKKAQAPAVKTVAATKSAAAAKLAGAQAAIAPSPGEVQLKAYDRAVRLFSSGNLTEALVSFEEATGGPASHVADKARSYVQVCKRRTVRVDLKIESAEDHFNYGVARLNAREVGEARHHFTRALSLKPDADHVLYTMALCCGLDGDGDGACANLKRAIDIDPRNRILARQDPEFLALAAHFPGLRALLTSEYTY